MKCEETALTMCTQSSRKVTIFTCCVSLFRSRQLDDGWCKTVRESCVTFASGQFLRYKGVCAQTLVSRSASENTSFALDA